MDIVGQPIWGTTNKATYADTAPIVAFTVNIGGDYGLARATLSASAQGTITYSSSNQLTALSIEPSYTSFGDGTGETANIVYGGLSQAADTVISQLFGPTPGSSAPSAPELEQPQRHHHALPPPRHRHALPKPSHLAETKGISSSCPFRLR